MAERIATSIKLSKHGHALAKAIANKLGLTMAGAIELSIRRLAEKEKVTITAKPRSHHKAKPTEQPQVTPIVYEVKPE